MRPTNLPPRWWLTIVVSSVLAAVPAVGRASPEGTSRPGVARLPGTAMPGLRPGNVVHLDGITLTVQPAGRGVWASALEVGGSRTLGVETAADGTVTVYRTAGVARNASPQKNGPRAPGACSDGGYALEGSGTWSGSYDWWFNVDTTPPEVLQDNATQAFRNTMVNWTHAINDCSLPDRVSLQTDYQGDTNKYANISTKSGCNARDGTNVVNFGDLASADLGFACWWTSGNKTIEGDMKLNDVEYVWTVIIGNLCGGYKYSVEDVATHEIGHVFGLADLSETLHGNLTMSTVMLPCQESEETLGLGDVRGMEAQY